MKWVMVLAGAGVALTYPLASRSTGTMTAPQLEAKLARVAGGMGESLPKRLEGGMLLTGVTAQKRVLIMRFTEVPDWRAEMTDAEAGKLMGGVICRQSGIGDAVRQGATIRFAFTATTGESLPTIDIDRC